MRPRSWLAATTLTSVARIRPLLGDVCCALERSMPAYRKSLHLQCPVLMPPGFPLLTAR